MGSMLRIWLCRALTASLLGVCLMSCVTAAEPTAAEQQYEQLKDAEKHADKLLGERWHKLVRQRQWVDKSGKHKTFARYVEHDPNGQWVKLLVLVKKGEESTYKEVTIPLSRLSKNDQALVKRIGIVRKQVETALADAPAGEYPTGESPSREGDAFGELAAAGELRGEAPGEMRGEPPGEFPPPGMEATGPPMAPPSLPFSLPSMPAAPAMEPWRTDFASFAANFAPSRGEEGPSTLSWGELHALKAVHDKERMLAMIKAIPAEQRPPYPILYQQGFAYGWARSGLGEVTWTASLDGSDAAAVSTTGLKHDLQLPAPLTLALVPDPEYVGDASRFVAGQPMQFIGRFAELGGFSDPPQLKLFVRLPTDKRKPKPAPVATPAPATAASTAPAAGAASTPAMKASAPVDHAALIAELEAWEDEGPPPKLAAKLEQAAAALGRSAVDEFAASAQVALTPYEEMPYLLTFDIPQDAVAPLIEEHQLALLAKGWYLFRMDRNYGLDRGDVMALLPTTDKYEVIAAVGTNGANYDVFTADIVKWLKTMEQQNPFVLTDAGFDSLAGRFTRPIADPDGLANRMYEFCPDIVDQGVEEVSALAAELQKPQAELFFWWD
jgi:hypothetical protein